MLHVSYKPAAMEWGGYQAWPFKGFSVEWHNFVQQSTPRQLTALGIPRPGPPLLDRRDPGRCGAAATRNWTSPRGEPPATPVPTPVPVPVPVPETSRSRRC